MKTAILVMLAYQAYGQSNIAILLRFREAPSPLVVSIMQRETAALLAGADLRPSWLSKDSGEDATLRVNFKGRCHAKLASPLTGAERDPFTSATVRLAATRVVQGKVTSDVEVDCDALNSAWRNAPVMQRNRMIGAALGKVLAHELYHRLLNSLGHRHEGLAKPALTFRELADTSTRFADAELRQLSSRRTSVH